MEKVHILHVEDDIFFWEIVQGFLDLSEIKDRVHMTRASSLEEMEQMTQINARISIAIIDGNFPAQRGWKIEFNFPKAVNIARSMNIPSIVAFSSDANRILALWEWERPDEFFDKSRWVLPLIQWVSQHVKKIL